MKFSQYHIFQLYFSNIFLLFLLLLLNFYHRITEESVSFYFVYPLLDFVHDEKQANSEHKNEND